MSSTIERISDIVSELGAFLNDVDLVLLVGLPVGVGALLAMEATCRYGVQAVDGGRFALVTRGGRQGSKQTVKLRPAQV